MSGLLLIITRIIQVLLGVGCIYFIYSGVKFLKEMIENSKK